MLIGLEILLELFLPDPSSRRLHDQSPERKRQAPARGSRSRFGGTDFGADFAPGNRRFLSGGESDFTKTGSSDRFKVPVRETLDIGTKDSHLP